MPSRRHFAEPEQQCGDGAQHECSKLLQFFYGGAGAGAHLDSLAKFAGGGGSRPQQRGSGRRARQGMGERARPGSRAPTRAHASDAHHVGSRVSPSCNGRGSARWRPCCLPRPARPARRLASGRPRAWAAARRRRLCCWLLQPLPSKSPSYPLALAPRPGGDSLAAARPLGASLRRARLKRRPAHGR